MRLGVYEDHVYRFDGETYSTDRASIQFLYALAGPLEEVVLFGRLDPEPGRTFYPLPEGVRLVPLPFYRRVTSIGGILRSLPGVRRAFLGELDRLDAMWVSGPYPVSLLFVWLARRRGKPVFLGVRQELPVYIRNRLPSRAWAWAVGVAHVLDWTYRRLARTVPTIVESEALLRQYGRPGAPVLWGRFSLIERADLAPLDEALSRSWEGEELRLLTVGRVDTEKNPLLLPAILAELRRHDPRWRLLVVGEGPMEDQVRRRAEELGVGDSLELLGYVASGQPLWELYRGANAFLHVSFTEGLPQVLIEAHAAGTPIVATDVGGVRAGLEDGRRGLLIPPDDAEAAVEALERLRDDGELRRGLVRRGLEYAAGQTKEAQLERVVAFLQQHVPGG